MVRSEGSPGRDLLCTEDHHRVSDGQKKAQEYFQSLGDDQQKQLLKRFEEEKITSDILRTLYDRNGIGTALFRTMLYNFLISK